MNRTDELEQCERRLRNLVSRWSEPDAALPPEAHLEESVVSELAYAQMQFERHLAELGPEDRETEHFRLELTMPAFTSLRLWYNVRSLDEDRGGDADAPGPRKPTRAG